MSWSSLPKFQINLNVGYGGGPRPYYPKTEFELLPVAMLALRRLAKCERRILSSLELIKISFFQGSYEVPILKVEGVLEENLKASREVRARISLPNERGQRLKAMMSIDDLFTKDHQKLILEKVEETETKLRGFRGFLTTA